nr:hypothetical protein CR513_50792 [Ipomoea batatas]
MHVESIAVSNPCTEHLNNNDEENGRIKSEAESHGNGETIDWVALGVDAGGYHVGALVHVGEEDGGADAGLGMEPGAAVAVTARADLEVEGAVHPILLRSEYRCQVLRH